MPGAQNNPDQNYSDQDIRKRALRTSATQTNWNPEKPKASRRLGDRWGTKAVSSAKKQKKDSDFYIQVLDFTGARKEN